MIFFCAYKGPKLADKIPNSKIHFSNYLRSPISDSFRFNTLRTHEVLEAIRFMKPKASTGIDNRSDRLLKETVFPM